MGKTPHFHVTALNKAPCSHSWHFEGFLPLVGGYASCWYKIKHSNCPPSPSWSAEGSCQPIAITTRSGSLSVWEAPSAKRRASVGLNFLSQVFLQGSCPHRSWKEATGAGPPPGLQHMVGRNRCPLPKAGQKVSSLDLRVRISPGSGRSHVRIISNT